MRFLGWALVSMAMIAVLTGCGGSGAPLAAIPVEGVTLGEWKGNGSLVTEPFTIEAPSLVRARVGHPADRATLALGHLWGIEWTGIGGVDIKVYRPGAAFPEWRLSRHEGGEGTFVHEAGTFYLSEAGTFVLSIETTGDWTVRAFVPD